MYPILALIDEERKPCKVMRMKVHVANHPLISHKLTMLRDERTDSPTFRLLVEELVTLLAYEATRDVRTKTVSIKTPVTQTTGVVLAEPRPVVVPILRAGLGMLEGMTKLLPTAQVGFLGMVRVCNILSSAKRPDDCFQDRCGLISPPAGSAASRRCLNGLSRSYFCFILNLFELITPIPHPLRAATTTTLSRRNHI